jgi:hypothetical protein
MIGRLFNEHPHSVGESYGEHLVVAGGFGMTMIVAGLACLAHGLFPALFERTGSAAIERLHAAMLVKRSRIGSDRR